VLICWRSVVVSVLAKEIRSHFVVGQGGLRVVSVRVGKLHLLARRITDGAGSLSVVLLLTVGWHGRLHNAFHLRLRLMLVRQVTPRKRLSLRGLAGSALLDRSRA